MDQGNKLLLLASIILVTVSGFSVWNSLWWLGLICIVIAEIYLVAVLALAAYRSDKVSRDSNFEVPNWMNNVFPTRLVGCFVVISLLVTLTLSFASLYIALNSSVPFKVPFNSSFDAIYFSYVTISTLGYGDFSPVSDLAKSVVLLQLSSGLLLLVGVFPLLISRISKFTSNN